MFARAGLEKEHFSKRRFLLSGAYGLSVVLWFKDNFPYLREIPFSHLFALIPLSGIVVRFLVQWIRKKKPRFPRRISREVALLIGLILLAAAARIPFLVSGAGLMTSDDAVPALMGKHISEGRMPPVCYYGQLYMGSLSSHFFALFFRLFGYSIFTLKCATLLIYLSFVMLMFLYLREVFSLAFAAAVTLFYSLPFTELVRVSLENTSAFGLVLFFGTLILYLAHLIGFKGRTDLLLCLGFVMGLAFWTHPITIGFILVAFLLLAVKMWRQTRIYSRLLGGAFLGALPQILVELFYRFQIFGFLILGKRTFSLSGLKSTLDFTASLFSSSRQPSRYLFVLLVFFGFFYVLLPSLKQRAFSPRAVFGLHALLFCLLYIFSYFSGKSVIRYLYPLYVSLPVVLLSAFLFLRPRWNSILPAFLVLVLFVSHNLAGTRRLLATVRQDEKQMLNVITAMKETGRKYWLGDYWSAYLLTAVSKESLIVASHTVRRYPPYHLAYWERTNRDNYVFLMRPNSGDPDWYSSASRWIRDLGLKAKKTDVDGCHLIYDVRPRLFPRALVRKPPENIPRLEIRSVLPERGYLQLVFRNVSPGGNETFLLDVELPEYAERAVWISSDQQDIKIEIPCPGAMAVRIRYHLEYQGIEIPASRGSLDASICDETPGKRQDAVVPLLGLGPEILYDGANRIACHKKVRLEINPGNAAPNGLRFCLYSPFGFSRAFWFGQAHQRVRAKLNGRWTIETELKDGESSVFLPLPRNLLFSSGNFVDLEFERHGWFFFAPIGLLSAFLDRIEIVP